MSALAIVMLAVWTLGPLDPWTFGLDVAAQSKPARVVSLVPAVTEMLFAMGAGDTVVGVSNFDTYPPDVKSRPRVGALVDPDFERILSLKPDLVIVYGSQADLIARLARARVPVFNYKHAGLADITQTIRTLGERIGRAGEARTVAARIEAGIEEVRRSVAGKPRPRTAIVFDREPGTLRNVYASAGIGFLHDMLLVAGGDDVFGDIKRQSLQATAEILLARAPDVIVEIRPDEKWTSDRIASERAVWLRLGSLPAAKTGRIHILLDDALPVPGPRVVEALKLLAKTLHPL